MEERATAESVESLLRKGYLDMQNQFDQYIEEVGAHLTSLPEGERQCELEEARQHLEAAVTARQEMGESEGEAIQNALKQFGDAGKVSTQLVRAYRRRILKQRMDSPFTTIPVVAALLAVAMPVIGCGLFPDVRMMLGIRLPVHFSEAQLFFYMITEPRSWLFGIVCGALLYRFAPRSAVRAVLPGYLLTMVGCYVWMGYFRADTWIRCPKPIWLVLNMLEVAGIMGVLAIGMMLSMRVMHRRKVLAKS